MPLYLIDSYTPSHDREKGAIAFVTGMPPFSKVSLHGSHGWIRWPVYSGLQSLDGKQDCSKLPVSAAIVSIALPRSAGSTAALEIAR